MKKKFEMEIKKVYIHTTKDGIKIPIHRLKTDHLANIIRYANNNPDNTNKKYLDIYKKELHVRNNYPNELVMNELTRFKSIQKTEWECIKTECDGRLNEYTATEITQTFCRTCWQEYKIKSVYHGSAIIEEDEFNPRPYDQYYQDHILWLHKN